MGVLNTKGVFGIPASASTVFNIVSILFGLSLAYYLSGGGWLNAGDKNAVPDAPSQWAIIGMAIGTLIGGAAQFLMQLPVAVQGRLSLLTAPQFYRSRREKSHCADDAGDPRHLGRADQCADKHVFRLGHRRCARLAQLRISLDAVPDRPVRRRRRNGGDPRAFAPGQRRQDKRIPRHRFVVDESCFPNDAALRLRADRSGRTDRPAHLRTRKI